MVAFDSDLSVVNGVLVTDIDVFSSCIVHNALRVFLESLQLDRMDKSFKAVKVFLGVFCVFLISDCSFVSLVLKRCMMRFVCIFGRR
jgi:hypothetical protein